MKSRHIFALFAFTALSLAAIAHVAFSRLGFNPTDDGFILAYARRIADGQVPHRDFITIRPAGSAFLWAPLVITLRELGLSDYLFLTARALVWLQWAGIALCWVYITRLHKSLPVALAALVCSFALTAHDFAVMAWHTTDGIFLCSVGTALAVYLRPERRWIGAVVIGGAILCKQNFAAYALLTPFLLPHLTRNHIAATLAPVAAYALAVAALGGGSDMLTQLASQSGIRESGITPYLNSSPLWMGVACALLAFGIPALTPAFGPLVLLGCTAALAFPEYAHTAPYFLFGAVAGAAAYRTVRGHSEPVALLALALSWSAGISMGYIGPACGVAALACALLALHPVEALRVSRAWSCAACPLALLAMFHVRETRIYRDGEAASLTAPVTLPGMRGIKTNAKTAAMNAELMEFVARADGARLAILPDFAAYWAASKTANPLPMDWPLRAELNRSETFGRTFDAVQSLPPGTVVILQRMSVDALPGGRAPLNPSAYSIARAVKSNYTRVWRGEYFDVMRRDEPRLVSRDGKIP